MKPNLTAAERKACAVVEELLRGIRDNIAWDEAVEVWIDSGKSEVEIAPSQSRDYCRGATLADALEKVIQGYNDSLPSERQ